MPSYVTQCVVAVLLATLAFIYFLLREVPQPPKFKPRWLWIGLYLLTVFAVAVLYFPNQVVLILLGLLIFLSSILVFFDPDYFLHHPQLRLGFLFLGLGMSRILFVGFFSKVWNGLAAFTSEIVSYCLGFFYRSIEVTSHKALDDQLFFRIGDSLFGITVGAQRSGRDALWLFLFSFGIYSIFHYKTLSKRYILSTGLLGSSGVILLNAIYLVFAYLASHTEIKHAWLLTPWIGWGTSLLVVALSVYLSGRKQFHHA